ncbi:MAG: hypothetical protein E4G94_02325 [ANME-2 cluster archaeon]|nr:MAG: hypothetical protein E4G94_02325 [ANME-2 cluster archaeon]
MGFGANEHFWNGNDIKTANATSCQDCHGSIDNVNGGNNSVSHYGKTKNLGSGNDYCNYCHNNLSTVFPVSGINQSISQHTAKTTVNCQDSTCHSSGRLHTTVLKKPPVTDSLCTTCHGSKQKHSNATKVVRHVPGSYFGQNSQKYYKDEANNSHYATTTDLENTTSGQTCEECHIDEYSPYDTPVQIDTALHGKGRLCQSSCHNKAWASSLNSSVHDSTNEIDPNLSCFSGEAGCHPGLVY